MVKKALSKLLYWHLNWMHKQNATLARKFLNSKQWRIYHRGRESNSCLYGSYATASAYHMLSRNRPFHVKQADVGSHLIKHNVTAGVHFTEHHFVVNLYCCIWDNDHLVYSIFQ